VITWKIQINEYRETIILLKNDVDKAGIFGSFAKNEEKKIVTLIFLFISKREKVSLILPD
jgi:predicted nucleotidyltransferase